MAFFKTFLLLGLAFAIVVLVSSEVSARELAETTQGTNVEQSNYADHGYGHGGHGHCGHGHGGHGGHGGHPAGEKQEVETEAGGN